jgi:membrane-associated phospholipid phosphatase
MIRAYVPWYLVRNYLAFTFVACLAALQLASAQGQRNRATLALVILIGTFLVFYAFAPELLTPGPAGGEMTFLFSGAALLAVIMTRLISKVGNRKSEVRIHAEHPEPRISHILLIWYFIFPLVSLFVVLFDVPLFHLLNGIALRTLLIDVLVQFLMNDYIVPTALVLVLLTMWFAGRDAEERASLQRTVLRALLALALASIVLKLINQVYFRPRPFTFDDSVRLLFYHPSDSTMPSNAATVCFALAIAVWLRQRRWGAVMLALGVGITLSRVVGGVHYPADVVVGVWLGGIWAWLVNRVTGLDRPLDAVVGLARRLALG